MAYDLACVNERFIGVMSGTMLGKPDAGVKTLTPVIHFHGLQDQVLPYKGNEHYQSVPDLIDSWRQHHGISRTSHDRKILMMAERLRIPILRRTNKALLFFTPSKVSTESPAAMSGLATKLTAFIPIRFCGISFQITISTINCSKCCEYRRGLVMGGVTFFLYFRFDYVAAF